MARCRATAGVERNAFLLARESDVEAALIAGGVVA